MDETLVFQRTTVAQLYAALLDRAPEASGMTFWVSAVESGASWESVVAGMLSAPAVRDAYPADQNAAGFVAALYETLFDREPDAAGLAFWADALDARGHTVEGRAWLLLQIVNAASQPLDTRPPGMSESDYAQALTDRALVANKAAAGVHFAVVLGSDDMSLASEMLARVTADPDSVQDAIDLANGVNPEPPVEPPVQPPEPPIVPPPAPPIITSATLTNATEPVISGTASPNTRVTVTVGGATYATITQAGAWTIDLSSATPISGALALDANGEGNPPAFSGRQKWSYAAIASFIAGVMPPSAMLGRSWL